MERIAELNRKRLEDLLSAGARVYLVKRDVPVYVWIDGRESAIFSFYNLKEGGQSKEVSFYTKDKHLIGILASIVDSYLVDAGAPIKKMVEFDARTVAGN